MCLEVKHHSTATPERLKESKTYNTAVNDKFCEFPPTRVLSCDSIDRYRQQREPRVSEYGRWCLTIRGDYNKKAMHFDISSNLFVTF